MGGCCGIRPRVGNWGGRGGSGGLWPALGGGRENGSQGRGGGGQCRKRWGGLAAPGSPRCAREIGRQEAAAGNPGAGNGRCRLPDAPQACETPPTPLPPPAAGYQPGMLPVCRPLRSEGFGGYPGFDLEKRLCFSGGSQGFLWSCRCCGGRSWSHGPAPGQASEGRRGSGDTEARLQATDQAGQLAKAGVMDHPFWRDVYAPFPPPGALEQALRSLWPLMITSRERPLARSAGRCLQAQSGRAHPERLWDWMLSPCLGRGGRGGPWG